jgi:hypothetical protein
MQNERVALVSKRLRVGGWLLATAVRNDQLDLHEIVLAPI